MKSQKSRELPILGKTKWEGLRQINNFFYKKETEKIELVARPGQPPWASWSLEARVPEDEVFMHRMTNAVTRKAMTNSETRQATPMKMVKP